jgi:sarcosine oxidase subunit gamma
MVEPATRRAPAVPEAAWLKALPSAARFAFHGAAAARAAAQPVWGPAFSEEACRANAHAARATLWLGPDEYLLLDWSSGGVPGADQPTPGSPEGSMLASPMFSGACPLDFDLAEFPVDMCTRTVLAKADIVLWRTQEHAFHLEVWRSFAGYVGGLLHEIASEFYPP